MFQTYPVKHLPQGEASTNNIAEFSRTVISRGIPEKSGDYMGLEAIYQANFGMVFAHFRHIDGYLAIFKRTLVPCKV